MTSPDFAAAQQRVLARRQEREAELRSSIEAQQARLAAWPAGRLPVTRFFGRNVLETWNLIRGREGTRPAYRVGQVDAELLDEELLALLKGQVADGLKYIGV